LVHGARQGRHTVDEVDAAASDHVHVLDVPGDHDEHGPTGMRATTDHREIPFRTHGSWR
jgi:hypothetical protein